MEHLTKRLPEIRTKLFDAIKDHKDGKLTPDEADKIIKTAKKEINSINKLIALQKKELKKAYPNEIL